MGNGWCYALRGFGSGHHQIMEEEQDTGECRFAARIDYYGHLCAVLLSNELSLRLAGCLNDRRHHRQMHT